MRKGKIALYFVLFVASLLLAFGVCWFFGFWLVTDTTNPIGIALIAIVFIIFYLIATCKTGKYIKEQEIKDGSTVGIALFFTFLTYFAIVSSIYLSIGNLIFVYLIFLEYAILGTIAHVFARGHRIMQGKNDVTTILHGLTHYSWDILQLIVLVVTTVIDIIFSFIADDWKQSKKNIQAKEQTEKYFREVSVDKPVNYSDGLNIEYRKFIETTAVEDNSDTRKTFADQYFKKVYDKD